MTPRRKSIYVPPRTEAELQYLCQRYGENASRVICRLIAEEAHREQTRQEKFVKNQ